MTTEREIEIAERLKKTERIGDSLYYENVRFLEIRDIGGDEVTFLIHAKTDIAHLLEELRKARDIISSHLKEQAEIYLADPDCPEDYRKDAEKIINFLGASP